MDRLSNITPKISKEEFNNEPVHYCKFCLSLAIRVLNEGMDYCDQCGGTNTEQTNIEVWENKFKEKYGKTLI